MSPRSSPAVRRPHLRARLQALRFQLFLPRPIPSKTASSPVSTGRVATSPVWPFLPWHSWRSGSNCCANLFPTRLRLEYWSIQIFLAQRPKRADGQAAARAGGGELQMIRASNDDELEVAFADMEKRRIAALVGRHLLLQPARSDRRSRGSPR